MFARVPRLASKTRARPNYNPHTRGHRRVQRRRRQVQTQCRPRGGPQQYTRAAFIVPLYIYLFKHILYIYIRRNTRVFLYVYTVIIIRHLIYLCVLYTVRARRVCLGVD